MPDNDIPGIDKKLFIETMNARVNELIEIRDYLDKIDMLPFEMTDEQRQIVHDDLIMSTKLCVTALMDFLNGLHP